MIRAKNWKHSFAECIFNRNYCTCILDCCIFIFCNKLWKNPCQRIEIRWSFVVTQSLHFWVPFFGPPCTNNTLEQWNRNNVALHLQNYTPNTLSVTSKLDPQPRKFASFNWPLLVANLKFREWPMSMPAKFKLWSWSRWRIKQEYKFPIFQDTLMSNLS